MVQTLSDTKLLHTCSLSLFRHLCHCQNTQLLSLGYVVTITAVSKKKYTRVPILPGCPYSPGLAYTTATFRLTFRSHLCHSICNKWQALVAGDFIRGRFLAQFAQTSFTMWHWHQASRSNGRQSTSEVDWLRTRSELVRSRSAMATETVTEKSLRQQTAFPPSSSAIHCPPVAGPRVMTGQRRMSPAPDKQLQVIAKLQLCLGLHKCKLKLQRPDSFRFLWIPSGVCGSFSGVDPGHYHWFPSNSVYRYHHFPGSRSLSSAVVKLRKRHEQDNVIWDWGIPSL